MKRESELAPCEPYYTLILRAMEFWHQLNNRNPRTSYVGGWLQQDHIEYSYILRLIDWWKPKKVMEIGYGLGGSALCLRFLLPDAIIVHVDIVDVLHFPNFSIEGVRYGHTVAKWLHQKKKWYFVCSDSTNPTLFERLRIWFGYFDVLIVDGNHTILYVTNDYKMYSLLVRPYGLIIFHDSRRDTQRAGHIEVRKALDTLQLKGFDVENKKVLSPGLFWTVKGL